MANRPAGWTDEKWTAHVEASKAESTARAAVEANPAATMMDFERRISALEGKKAPAPAPAAAKPTKVKK